MSSDKVCGDIVSELRNYLIQCTVNVHAHVFEKRRESCIIPSTVNVRTCARTNSKKTGNSFNTESCERAHVYADEFEEDRKVVYY